MNRKLIFIFIIVSMFFIEGCWDSMELNDRAIEIAWGIDKTKNKKIQFSTQIILPSKIGIAKSSGGGGSHSDLYIVETGIGKDALDALQQMQSKFSRKLFPGQRRIVVIGEQLARQGIKDLLDIYTRDPSLNLLTDIFIIKGSTAKNFLESSYPLELLPSLGASKEYVQIGAPPKMEFLNFLLSAKSEGRSPTMPVIVLESPSSTEEENQEAPSRTSGFQISGIGIFNKDLKLIGFLNEDEARMTRWVTKKLNKLIITAFVPGKKGFVSFDANTVDSNVQANIHGDQIKILVTLKGHGVIRENNTGLDLTQIFNVTLVQNELEKQAEQNVLKTIKKVQKEYRKDIFGFSDAIQRKDLQQWESIKVNWDKEFSEAEISVKVNLTVHKIGVTGASLIE